MQTMIKIVLGFLIGTALSFANEFILVDDYYNNNAKEKKKFMSFSEVVRQNASSFTINQKAPVKIVMVYPGEQVSDYWRRSKDSFEKRLQELGIKYELIDHFTKPSVEVRKQAKQILKAVKNKADYLVFTLDVRSHSKFIERVVSLGKPKIILQNITTPKKSWGEKQPFMYVGFDHVIGSEILAKEYVKEVGTEGNYAVLYGTKGYVSSMRGDSFINYMNKYTNLNMVASYYTDFNKAKAKRATLDLLSRTQDLKFIYACSTDVGLGVIDALKEKGLLGKIKVNGWGGGSSELAAIVKKEMDLTVMRNNDDNGVAMAEAIKLDLQTQSDMVPLIYSGDFNLIKMGISQKALDAYKKSAFRYSK